jgi:hypothetical protein
MSAENIISIREFLIYWISSSCFWIIIFHNSNSFVETHWNILHNIHSADCIYSFTYIFIFSPPCSLLFCSLFLSIYIPSTYIISFSFILLWIFVFQELLFRPSHILWCFIHFPLILAEFLQRTIMQFKNQHFSMTWISLCTTKLTSLIWQHDWIMSNLSFLYSPNTTNRKRVTFISTSTFVHSAT